MKRKIIIVLSLCILILTAAVLVPSREELEIYDKTLRLHVIANSDSDYDQALKLKVRDTVLEHLGGKLENVKSRDEAINIIKSETETLKRAANECLDEQNSGYCAEIAFCEEEYPRKQYESVTLPAGKYLSLQVKIGKSEGKNWWCVLFPTICTSAAEPKEKMTQAGFTTSQIRLITETDKPKYKLKFKIVEIIKDIFD